MEMQTQDTVDFERIKTAIEFITDNFKTQPGLEEIAASVHLSPAHFQRMFSEWAGTSPKRFLQYISIEYAKTLLKEDPSSIFDVAYHTGLSGSSRLHDLFIKIEGMTPGEYRNGGKNLLIQYSQSDSPFGKIFIASTDKGICSMSFENSFDQGLEDLKLKFPAAKLIPKTDALQEQAKRIFHLDWSHLPEIKLHLRGTEFQIKVWETLLKIPMGKRVTYGTLAAQIDRPAAARAVGTAIGSNPVAFLIPCHRVIQSSGTMGGYMWGKARKAAMLGWEAGKTATN